MSPRPFDRRCDLDALNGWYTARKMPIPVISLLPETGLIVPGVAAAFLLLTDSSLALLHECVTNPSALSRDRHEALSAIYAELCTIAASKGYVHLMTWTADSGIVRRMAESGFSEWSGQRVFFKELSREQHRLSVL